MVRRFAPFAVLTLVVVVVAAWWLWSAPAATPRSVSIDPSTQRDPRPVRADSDRARVLFGEVTSTSGQPIGGARITVVQRDVSKVVVAGSDGGFTVDPFPDDLDRLEFAATGYVNVVVEAKALPHQVEAFWAQVLTLDASLPGIVVSVIDRPLGGAVLVRVDEVGGRPRFNAVGGVSDDTGRLPRPETDGHQYLVAHAAHGAVVLANNANAVSLPEAGTIDGRVVDDDRRPLVNAVITVRPGPIDDPLVAGAMRLVSRRESAVVIDDEGRFELRVPALKLVVEATATGHRPRLDLAVSPRAGLTMPLEIRLDKSPTVAGIVVDGEGAPVAGALVGVDSGGGDSGVRTDAEGRFVVDQVAARPSSITVEAEGYRTITLGGIDGASSRLDDLRIELVAGHGQEVVGIGVTVGAVVGGGAGVLVRTVEPNTPAERAGVVAGEIIVAVDGVNLDDDLNASMGRVRGAPGTSVVLHLQDERGGRRFLTVERDNIAVPRRARIR